MAVTLEGILIFVNPVQKQKARSPIVVTLLGISKLPFIPIGTRSIFVLFLLYNTPPSDEYDGLSGATVILVYFSKFLSQKVLTLISVMVDGISISIKLMQL